MNNIYRKQRSFAPQGFFSCEAHGLRWLAEAQSQGGTRVAKVISYTDNYLDIERIFPIRPNSDAAWNFGRSLARLHNMRADYFGQAPSEYQGTCYFGPLDDPVPMDSEHYNDIYEYLGRGRLLPMVSLGIRRQTLTSVDLELTQQVISKLPELLQNAAEDYPSRVHGDLWSGNVLWTESNDRHTTEAVLIDPAAHGGHREEDLAMLDLFGISYYDRILEGYESVYKLAEGFEKRITLWQLYPIAGHCVFFGGGYVSQYRAMCKRLLQQ